MKQIFLLRHAKSDWSNLGQQDFERPLSKRGINNAAKISEYVRKNNYSVDKVYCSSSERTKQTFDLCSDGFNFPINQADYLDELYFGGISEVSRLIKSLKESISSVLLVGHNPTMHYLVEELTEQRLIKFPTCSLAEITTENLWKDVPLKKCTLKSFIKPKELKF